MELYHCSELTIVYVISTRPLSYFAAPHPDIRGYILPPSGKSNASLLEATIRNEFIGDIVERLSSFEAVESRFLDSPDEKRSLAKAFRELHGSDINRRYHRVFIESGSTTAYVAKALSEILPKCARSVDSPLRPIVSSNNAVAYLHLWLCKGVMCHPVPETPPDRKYAGMYGLLAGRRLEPDYALPPLQQTDPEALGLIKELRQEVFGDRTPRTRSLILGAISGLKLSANVTATEDDAALTPTTERSTLGKLTGCRWFHVGSYENKLFKRTLYLSRIPMVVFIHDTKIDCPVRVGRCHFLFDRGWPWREFINTYPLSIWVACTSATLENAERKIKKYMNRGRWRSVVYAQSSGYPIIICHNEPFRQACKKVGVTPYGS